MAQKAKIMKRMVPSSYQEDFKGMENIRKEVLDGYGTYNKHKKTESYTAHGIPKRKRIPFAQGHFRVQGKKVVPVVLTKKRSNSSAIIA